jgi:hypothetical protein
VRQLFCLPTRVMELWRKARALVPSNLGFDLSSLVGLEWPLE